MTNELHMPDSVITDASFVMDRAKDVTLAQSTMTRLAEMIKTRLQEGIDDIEAAFGTTGSLEQDVNLIFFETAVNFCFWADLDQEKWMIERDGKQFGGWYSLAACFDRAITRGVPVYDATFMVNLTETSARELFAGLPGGVEIPLLAERVRNLNEAGEYLLQHHEGQAIKLLESVEFSAPRLAERVAIDLFSFRDGAMYDDKWVWILKRAQILGSDLSQLSARYPEFHIADCDKLTAFADYRLPQILRQYGCMKYSLDLARRVDSGEHLESGSSPEVEIRAGTIMACEALKKLLPNRTSADIDLGLWLLSQDMRNDPALSPHHRTLGIFY